MEKQKKKQVKKVVSWVLILSLVALLAALPMIAANEEPVSGPQASILSTKVEHRDISTAVLGGGVITAEESVEITIPAAVKVKEYLVDNGDVVTEGQPIATVDRVSVMTAITQVQETLETITEELNDIRNETESSKVTATAGGTVKAVYAEVGEDVQDVLLRDGALAVISLDGLMAVQIERNINLSGGDKVCVTLPDGTEVAGRVESNLEGILTVTVEDDGFAAGQEVKVTTEEGERIGSGELYIHSPWHAMAYFGTVSRVRISEGEEVSAGARLFDLEIEGHTAKFDSLASQHREYEELMLELFKMYQSETVTAPQDGIISGVDATGAYMLSASAGGWKISFLSNGPNEDQNSYTNYVGKVTNVAIDGLHVILNVQAQDEVVDYFEDLEKVNKNTELMTEEVVFYGYIPTYQLEYEEEIIVVQNPQQTASGGENQGGVNPAADGGNGEGENGKTEGENGNSGGANGTDGTQTPPVTEIVRTPKWVQVNPAAGDILLFACSGTEPVWVIRVGRGNLSQGGEVPGMGGGMSGMGGGGMPGMGGGGMGGMGGNGQEESDELYALDTLTVASVTAQMSVTVPFSVDELDVLKLSMGQTATVTVEALPGQRFPGVVTNISASGENEGGNSKFTVTVTLDKIPEMLPGMSAAVSIVLATAEQVMSLPVAALNENGMQTQVFTGYNEETGEFVNPKTVTTGASDGEYVQILSGVEQGETVYYPYYDTLVLSNAPKAGGGYPFG